jgi:hypothetical protein
MFLKMNQKNVHRMKDIIVAFLKTVWDKARLDAVQTSERQWSQLIIAPERMKFCIIIPPIKVIVRKW